MKTNAFGRMRRAAGFTMVELMVALVIGLLLVLVIAQLFSGSRRTFATTDDISRMQESIRFSTQILTRTLHQAGYYTSPNALRGTIFAAPNLAVEGITGGGTTPDEIRIRFQGNGVLVADGTVVNCRGERIVPNVMSENRFSIENVIKVDAGVNVQVPSLVCRTDTDNFVGRYVVVSDVENMKILYGEDTNGDLSVDRFVPFTGVTDVANIRVVRVAMLFRSPNLNIAPPAAVTAQTYTLNGTAIATNDTRARRDVSFTVGIRNQAY